MLRGASEIASFIRENYSGKVVEVGAGFMPEVALSLKKQMTVVATDRVVNEICGLFLEKDDIFSPSKKIYQGASLLYSIRPPLEVQFAMGCLAKELRSDILIRPLEDEIAELPGFSKRLVNMGQARFYIFELTPETRNCFFQDLGGQHHEEAG